MTQIRPMGNAPTPGLARPPPSAATAEQLARLARLEKAAKPAARRARAWRRASVLTLVACLAATGVAMAALVATTNTFRGMHAEVNKYDTATFDMGGATTGLASASYSAAATTPAAPAELELLLGIASTVVPEGDWYYQVDLVEVAATTLSSGTYKANLYVNGVDKGALYFTQGTALPLSIEGITLRWDIGPTLSTAATYVVKVTAA